DTRPLISPAARGPGPECGPSAQNWPGPIPFAAPMPPILRGQYQYHGPAATRAPQTVDRCDSDDDESLLRRNLHSLARSRASGRNDTDDMSESKLYLRDHRVPPVRPPALTVGKLFPQPGSRATPGPHLPKQHRPV